MLAQESKWYVKPDGKLNIQKVLEAYIKFYKCIDFAGERFAFELKLSSKKALTDGKTQLVDYLQRLSLDSGWLIIFSRKPVEDIETVGEREIVEEQGKRIEVIWL
jgi:hypothetical protein